MIGHSSSFQWHYSLFHGAIFSISHFCMVFFLNENEISPDQHYICALSPTRKFKHAVSLPTRKETNTPGLHIFFCTLLYVIIMTDHANDANTASVTLICIED